MATQLLAHPNVTCTPHLGASTEEAQVNVAKDVAVQVRACSFSYGVGVGVDGSGLDGHRPTD
jgi:lactate dehydrogenase-like 2-hydroxyacid dehydrogenase